MLAREEIGRAGGGSAGRPSQWAGEGRNGGRELGQPAPAGRVEVEPGTPRPQRPAVRGAGPRGRGRV